MDSPNFILYNLPRWANRSDDNLLVSVGYDSMKETLAQFGSVRVISIKNGTLSASFKTKKDAKNAHALINRMMIGKNIVRTQCV